MDLTEHDGLLATIYQTDDGGDWIVRPLHHIEDEPIIRRIGDRFCVFRWQFVARRFGN